MADKATLNEEETREVMQIRADIAQTRAELSDTIGAIQEKLNPSRLREQAMDTVREATIGRVENMAGRIGDRMSDTGRGIRNFVSSNPIPLALIGLGAGWLAMSLRGGGRERGREWRSDEYRGREFLRESRESYPLGYESGGAFSEAVTPTHEADYFGTRTGDGGRAGGRMHHARERLSEAASTLGDRVSSTASDAGQRLRERSSDLRHRASDMGHTVSERAHMVADRTRSIAHDTGERAREFAHSATQKYEENPFMGGMLALALGAATGMLIPISDKESELMGSRRDELLGRAREMGRERIERARHVAEEVASDTKEFVQRSVKEHAREEGLMGSGRGESDVSGSHGGGTFTDRSSGGSEFGYSG